MSKEETLLTDLISMIKIVFTSPAFSGVKRSCLRALNTSRALRRIAAAGALKSSLKEAQSRTRVREEESSKSQKLLTKTGPVSLFPSQNTTKRDILTNNKKQLGPFSMRI